jgi:hypothetical protein
MVDDQGDGSDLSDLQRADIATATKRKEEERVALTDARKALE